jgi:hypothetical protein
MSTDMAPTSSRDDLPSVDRLLTLSDGVVAIAITLLVLQLNVPDVTKLTDPASASELATQLGKGADSLISYVISFTSSPSSGSFTTGSSAGSPGSERAWPGGTSRSGAAKYCWLLLAVAPRLADRWSASRAVR